MSTAWKLGVLILLAWSAINTWHQLDQAKRFMGQGPRFTAADGRALCERVRALEERSYGFRDAGQTPLACDYGSR